MRLRHSTKHNLELNFCRWYRVEIRLVANYHVVVHDVFKGSHQLAVIRNHLLVYIFINKRFKVDLLCVRLTDVGGKAQFVVIDALIINWLFVKIINVVEVSFDYKEKMKIF